MSMSLPPSDSLEWASAGALSAGGRSAGGLATIFTNTTMPCDVDDAVLGECESEAFAEALLPSESAERSWHGAAGALTASEAVSAAPSPMRLLQVRIRGRAACMHMRISGRVAQYSMAPVTIYLGVGYGQNPACIGLPRYLRLLLTGPPNADCFSDVERAVVLTAFPA